MNREEVVRMYLDEGLSARQIAASLHLSRPRVSSALREAGLALAGRGRGRRRPNRRLPEPEDLSGVLRQLYVEQRLTSKTVGELLGMSERTVRERLEEHGIPRRTKGGFDRQDRLDPDPAAVAELYLDRGMTAKEIVAVLGGNPTAVLRTAHAHGLPVRQPPSVEHSGPGWTLLVEALYSDPLVAETLERHGVPKVPPFGPIWARFPEPVPVTRELVRDL
jgi:DNA-binding CsgD family transcriptional regulator